MARREMLLAKDWTMRCSERKNRQRYQAVFASLPTNTSMKFDLLLTHEKLINDIWTNGQSGAIQALYTYLQLKKGTDVAKF